MPAQYSKLLLSHSWPGNVRELKNAADRFVLGITEFKTLDTQALDDSAESYDEQMDRFERQLLEAGLWAANGQVKETAELLNLSNKTLYRKMKKHQLDKNTFKLSGQ